MRLVVIALALPLMFIAMGLAALLVPYCNLPASMAAAYLVLLPVAYYAKGYLYLRPKYFLAALAMLAGVWAVELALEPLLRGYSVLVEALAQVMSSCPHWRLYFVATAVVLAPVVEEALFRGPPLHRAGEEGGAAGWVRGQLACLRPGARPAGSSTALLPLRRNTHLRV